MQTLPLTNFNTDLSRFEKICEIKKGGFGIVYKAKDKQTNNLVAAKVMLFGNTDEETKKKMIEREIKIMMAVNHPTLIKIQGYSLKDFQNDNNPTILMDFIENGSLQDVLNKIRHGRGPDDYSETTRQIILIGIARGMKYLHDRKITHRDLSPNNILLDEDLHPVITDFGLAKIVQNTSSLNQSTFGGTKQYMAPEVITRKNEDGFKSDVYSFGIIMYEIVTDSPPYPEFSTGKMSEYDFNHNVVEKDYRPSFNKKSVSDDFQDLMKSCWQKDPTGRPSFDEIYEKLLPNNECVIDGADIDELNIYVDSLNEANDNLDQLSIENFDLASENEKLKKELEKIKNDYSAQTKELQKTKDELQNMHNAYSAQTKELQKTKDELQNMHNAYSAQTKELQKTKIELQNKTNELNQANASLKDLTSKNKTAQSRNKKLRNENDKLSNDLNGLQKKHSQLVGTYKQLDNLYNQVQDEKSRLLNKEKQNESEIDSLQKKLRDAEKEIDYQKNLNIQIIEDNESTMAEMNKYKDQTEDINRHKKANLILLNELKIVRKQLFDLNARVTKLNVKPYEDNLELIRFLKGPKPLLNPKELEELEIPSSVTIIFDRQFKEYENLKKVVIPSSVIEIGCSAFTGCVLLNNVTIPKSVRIIKRNAFRYCNALTEISVPSSVMIIGEMAFALCTNLAKAAILSTDAEIGKDIFDTCISLKDLTIPSHVDLKFIGITEPSKINVTMI